MLVFMLSLPGLTFLYMMIAFNAFRSANCCHIISFACQAGLFIFILARN